MITILAIVAVSLIVAGVGLYLYKRHKDHIDPVIDPVIRKVEDKIDDIKK